MSLLESEAFPPVCSPRPVSKGQGRKGQKRLRERGEPLSPREQGKHLWETVNQARRLIELADHKARYALLVMGAVNAGIFILATRSEHYASLVPPAIRSWFSLLIIPFGLVALVFLVDAYNTLRPRPPVLPASQARRFDREGRPVGLVFWDELLGHSMEQYQRSWETVHRGQLNNELAAMAYSLAEGIRAKYRALRRLYVELLLMILLAGVLLAVPMTYGFLSNGPGILPVP
jgi:hypothetical protein